LENLLSRHQSQYPEGDTKPRDIIEELTEAFVKVNGTTQRYVEWIHPSYRDLVIEQLQDGGSLKSEFLNRMNLSGIKLALSQAGGTAGRRRFPLVSSSSDWDVLERRAIEVATRSGTEHCAALLASLADALDCAVGQERSSVQRILKGICRTVRARWDSDQVELDASAINAYGTASERVSPMEPMPALEISWQAAVGQLDAWIDNDDDDFLFWANSLDEFLAMVEAVKNLEPRLLRRVNFPAAISEPLDRLLLRVDRELKADRSYTDKEGYDGEADASFSLAQSLERLDAAAYELEKPVTARINGLKDNANRCREKYAELESEESEEADASGDADYRELVEGSFDVQALFVDL
jgi:hypothetical protein